MVGVPRVRAEVSKRPGTSLSVGLLSVPTRETCHPGRVSGSVDPRSVTVLGSVVVTGFSRRTPVGLTLGRNEDLNVLCADSGKMCRRESRVQPLVSRAKSKISLKSAPRSLSSGT